ncbi:hypothetical protein HX109_09055 [Galbibacter sp. BG1]|uniref:hypothetical protein n=1 Tax=Galbibacter sp. BG1 TaxID=1170699 RepID=UPI0015BF5A84|nr:hypothetical protein [Galbibacter sp. BG1]QLE01696.1 hypothetical protein HX109_09055 [Galbibacter sp. BG1]
MKNLSLLAILSLVLLSCNKQEKKQKDLNPLEEIAYANGFENWNKVDAIKFTFNVDRDTTHFERSWVWKPKKNEVTATKDGESITYDRNQILSDEELVADKNFINDVYWLLAPYKLVWDTGLEYEEPTMAMAPISKDSLQKLTITYSNEGGYTPGDAYDFYYDEDHEVKEWVYREDNSTSNCMMTTWEDYKNFEGLKLATMHQNENGVFKLYFTNISVTASKN